jgi:hypothetical protein
VVFLLTLSKKVNRICIMGQLESAPEPLLTIDLQLVNLVQANAVDISRTDVPGYTKAETAVLRTALAVVQDGRDHLLKPVHHSLIVACEARGIRVPPESQPSPAYTGVRLGSIDTGAVIQYWKEGGGVTFTAKLALAAACHQEMRSKRPSQIMSRSTRISPNTPVRKLARRLADETTLSRHQKDFATDIAAYTAAVKMFGNLPKIHQTEFATVGVCGAYYMAWLAAHKPVMPYWQSIQQQSAKATRRAWEEYALRTPEDFRQARADGVLYSELARVALDALGETLENLFPR